MADFNTRGSFSAPLQQPPLGIDPSNIYKPTQIPAFEENFMLQPKEPKPAPPETTGHVYGAVYSGVPVYEMMCRNVAVMRRQKDSFLNATQVLKVAQIDKGKRTKILEREILNRDHEKVQGGYGKYQGTWIPFERGLELAKMYAVDGLLRPLFDYMPPSGRSERTPTKEQVLGTNRQAQKKASHGSYHPEKRQKLDPTPHPLDESHSEFREHHFTSETPFCEQLFDFNDPKGYYVHNPYMNGFYHSDPYAHYPTASPPVQSPVALAATEASSERHRSAIMALFLNNGNHNNFDMLYPHSILPSDFDIDLILDDQGHTALHWAAALANIQLLTLLIQKGAQPDRRNFAGETALIRAVMVEHNFDRGTFLDLLNILKDQIYLPDKKNRTILHHICLSSVTKSKTQPSSTYYMKCLLDFLVNNVQDEAVSSQLVHSDSQVTMSDRLKRLLNAQDVCGDTALNISARVGNHQLFDLLAEGGADENIANIAGLRPLDFGFAVAISTDYDKEGPKNKMNMNSTTPDMCVVYPSITTELDVASSQVTDVHADEQKKEDKVVAELHQQLAQMSKEIAQYRKEINPLKAENAKIAEYKARIAALEKACQEKSAPEKPEVTARSTAAEDEISRLKAALSHQKMVESRLCQELVTLRASVGRHELSCKKIISVCCNVPLQNVEELIEPLMEALECDGFNLDARLVSAFLTRLREDNDERAIENQSESIETPAVSNL